MITLTTPKQHVVIGETLVECKNLETVFGIKPQSMNYPVDLLQHDLTQSLVHRFNHKRRRCVTKADMNTTWTSPAHWHSVAQGLWPT